MTGPIAVFIGPTLSWRVAADHLQALYFPAAQQGSVYNVIRHHEPAAIVLVDGAFGAVPAVRHKELLWALHRRIPVYGAASMGALRAAELAGWGMQGFGLVYRWYRRTILADDDEVAVAMGPAELDAPAVSDALINMRVTFRRAVRGQVISRATQKVLVERARATPFGERSYEALLDDARDLAPPGELAALSEWLRHNRVDQKGNDALGLLKMLAAHPERIPRDREALSDRRPFPVTTSWLADLADAGFEDELTAKLRGDSIAGL